MKLFGRLLLCAILLVSAVGCFDQANSPATSHQMPTQHADLLPFTLDDCFKLYRFELIAADETKKEKYWTLAREFDQQSVRVKGFSRKEITSVEFEIRRKEGSSVGSDATHILSQAKFLFPKRDEAFDAIWAPIRDARQWPLKFEYSGIEFEVIDLSAITNITMRPSPH